MEDAEKVEKKQMKTISELKKSISETESDSPSAKNEKASAKKNQEDAQNHGGENEAALKKDKSGKKDDSADEQSLEISKKVEEAEARASESLDKYVRTLAEFDNFRKRTTKEKAAMYDSGAMDVIKALLPVIDSFERAMASCGEDEKNSSVYTGMTLIYKQLRQFMEENGISEIDAIGCEFDPEVHSAVAHTDDPEYGENEIIEELQKGYMLKDKVLRHSMVRVAN